MARDVYQELQEMGSLDCPVAIEDTVETAIVGDALQASAAYVRREVLASHAPEVSSFCAARYAAWRVLARLPDDWTVAQARVALESARYPAPTFGQPA